MTVMISPSQKVIVNFGENAIHDFNKIFIEQNIR